ncbi:hypothetical protein CQA57_03040 [Helicobacter anseris]|uniref:Alpha/beta hydrolase n=1 Tax=Helicobacter anseris TaxID=375926 RepID=A0A3D8JB10_9HELI|nr:hypothetical protein [Helicobacter anseris]RDU74081.1 hypothetical protein CQA57_03040 [Helicobacter anseris]
MLFPPIIITPSNFDYPNKNKVKSFGDGISQSESFVKAIDSDCKKAIIFAGGFCDSFTKVVFNHFYTFEQEDFCKFYSTYDGLEYFLDIFKLLETQGLEIYIIAHSWGACNSIKTLFKTQTPIKYLLTLDSISYSSPKPLKCVNFWENVYIENHFSFNASNIVALIGHPQGSIKFANLNTALNPPYAHENVGAMLAASQLSKKIDLR